MKYKIIDKQAKSTYEVEAINEQEAKLSFFDTYFDLEVVEVVEEKKEIPNEYYYQRNKRYKDLKLGFSDLSFQNYGCFTCCLAYLVKKDPIEVHEILKENNCYSGAMIKSKETAEVLGLELLKGNSNIHGKTTDIKYMPNFNCIKEVKLGKSQHFVVRLVDESGKRQIFDPWTGEFLSINYYPFVSYRLFKNNNFLN